MVASIGTGSAVAAARRRAAASMASTALVASRGARGGARAWSLAAQVARRCSATSANTASWKKAPAGYYLPRIAVGSFSIVGSIALYDLIAQSLGVSGGRGGGEAPAPSQPGAWEEQWDSSPVEEESKEAISQLRSGADPEVDRRHVIFVRHAQAASSADAAGASAPAPAAAPGAGDAPAAESGDRRKKAKAAREAAVAAALSPTGARQAELVGKRLRELFSGEVTAVYCAGSPEAKATAQVLHKALCKGLKKDERPLLVESPLLAEGVPIVPIPTPDALKDIDEAEVSADASRAENAFRGLIWRPQGADPKNPGLTSVEVVVGHGNMMRYLVCRALQLPPSGWSRMAACHCTISWLDIGFDGSVGMREFGGAGHLPPDLITYF